MPSSNMPIHGYYADPRFLMLPVSPARSTDSQQDASCHSKHSTSHSSFSEDVITEALMLSAGALCLPTNSTSSSESSSGPHAPVFRPTEWQIPTPTSPATPKRIGGALSPLESFWMIRRSYAFDEDDDDDNNDNMKEEECEL
jgi:hypothetical protein